MDERPRRDSLADALRAVPVIWKVIGAIAAATATIATASIAVASWYQDVPSTADVEAVAETAVREHNEAPRTRNPSKSPHPEYAAAITALEETSREAIDAVRQESRAQRRRDTVMLELLVSMHAAALESDPHRRDDAAAWARDRYRKALERMEPEDAADYALKARPPWR